MPEFYGWLGIWFVMQLHPGYQMRDFFSVKNRTTFWNPSFLGYIMSGKRFEQINECIRLRNIEDNPDYRDKFFWVREMIDCFNENMEDIFSPS